MLLVKRGVPFSLGKFLGLSMNSCSLYFVFLVSNGLSLNILIHASFFPSKVFGAQAKNFFFCSFLHVSKFSAGQKVLKM